MLQTPSANSLFKGPTIEAEKEIKVEEGTTVNTAIPTPPPNTIKSFEFADDGTGREKLSRTRPLSRFCVVSICKRIIGRNYQSGHTHKFEDSAVLKALSSELRITPADAFLRYVAKCMSTRVSLDPTKLETLKLLAEVLTDSYDVDSEDGIHSTGRYLVWGDYIILSCEDSQAVFIAQACQQYQLGDASLGLLADVPAVLSTPVDHSTPPSAGTPDLGDEIAITADYGVSAHLHEYQTQRNRREVIVPESDEEFDSCEAHRVLRDGKPSGGDESRNVICYGHRAVGDPVDTDMIVPDSEDEMENQRGAVSDDVHSQADDFHLDRSPSQLARSPAELDDDIDAMATDESPHHQEPAVDAADPDDNIDDMVAGESQHTDQEPAIVIREDPHLHADLTPYNLRPKRFDLPIQIFKRQSISAVLGGNAQQPYPRAAPAKRAKLYGRGMRYALKQKQWNHLGPRQPGCHGVLSDHVTKEGLNPTGFYLVFNTAYTPGLAHFGIYRSVDERYFTSEQ
ncbi:hypothetical protein HDV00_004757 [Rhizophlyctis rosea]|nr:hypothetical protein HDV00_004757 [Rhizophlyctis rosea]